MRTPSSIRLPHALCIGATITLGAAASAQWPSDAALNLPVCTRSGLQNLPKIHRTAGGGCYISWFDGYPTGFDVYLQSLDPLGHALWGQNGILAADRSCSSTQDYGLGVDAEGNALLVYRDEIDNRDLIIASRISPDGEPLWGGDGLLLASATSPDFIGSPKIVGTSDGHIVAAWSEGSHLILQKLDAAGEPLWGDGVSLSGTGEATHFLCDLHAAGDGAVIVSWVRRGWGSCDPGHLYAQKLDADGGFLWGAQQRGGEHLAVYDDPGGSLPFACFPPFITDGGGGAVFCWYRNTPDRQCFAQHVAADGIELFPHNGAAASLLENPRAHPSACHNPDTGETFLFWLEENWSLTQHGVHGQKFDESGARAWGDQARQFVAVSPDGPGYVQTVQCGDGAMVFYDGDSTHGRGMNLFARRINAGGADVWTPAATAVCLAQSNPHDVEIAVLDDGTALLAWVDGRNADDDVYAQNIHPDGTLGIRGDVNGDGVVDVLDLLAVLAAWGPCPGCAEDVNGDGVVDVLDLLAVLAAWTM